MSWWRLTVPPESRRGTASWPSAMQPRPPLLLLNRKSHLTWVLSSVTTSNQISSKLNYGIFSRLCNTFRTFYGTIDLLRSLSVQRSFSTPSNRVAPLPFVCFKGSPDTLQHCCWEEQATELRWHAGRPTMGYGAAAIPGSRCEQTVTSVLTEYALRRLRSFSLQIFTIGTSNRSRSWAVGRRWSSPRLWWPRTVGATAISDAGINVSATLHDGFGSWYFFLGNAHLHNLPFRAFNFVTHGSVLRFPKIASTMIAHHLKNSFDRQGVQSGYGNGGYAGGQGYGTNGAFATGQAAGGAGAWGGQQQGF